MGWLADLKAARDGGGERDVAELEKLGYKQELARHMRTLQNFAVCFSLLSPVTGITGTFTYMWQYAGPVSLVFGWALVCLMSTIVGLALAELASAFPTAGGMYYWAGRMGGRRCGSIAAWIVGFFTVLGTIAGTAGTVFTIAVIISEYVLLGTGGANAGGTVLDHRVTVAICAGVAVMVGLLNTFSVRLIQVVCEMSMWVNIAGVAAFVIILPALAPTRQPASWVFGTFAPDTAYSGITNGGLTFLLSLLGSLWSISGYDSAAHMAEETQGASVASAMNIVFSIWAAFLSGLAYILALLFSVQNPANILSPAGATASGNGPMQITWDVFYARFGSGAGALGLFAVPLLCALFCANAALTIASRIMWALSRDGTLRISRWLATVDPKTKTPTAAVWACVFCSILMVLPALYNYTAFEAVTSISVVGMYIGFLVPLVLRMTMYRDRFKPGPFHLGPFSAVINGVAIAWVVFVIILFCVPQVVPVNYANLNYAPIAVGITLLIALGWWFVNARTWFKGPKQGWDPADAVLPTKGACVVGA